MIGAFIEAFAQPQVFYFYCRKPLDKWALAAAHAISRRADERTALLIGAAAITRVVAPFHAHCFLRYADASDLRM
jgi:hypothetical protein